MFEMAAPVDPARAWPRAGRAGPSRIELGGDRDSCCL